MGGSKAKISAEQENFQLTSCGSVFQYSVMEYS